MHYLSLLAALCLPLSVIAALCNAQGNAVLASGWYEGWSTTVTPEMIPFNKLSKVVFAFATPSNDASTIDLDPVSTQNLPKVVAAAHTQGVPVILSIGGFSGSRYFSMGVSDANRSTFVNAVMGLVTQYDVDGVEIDWEYPNNQPALGCNTISNDDSANFLAFLKDLRTSIGSKTISAATSDIPWMGPDGTPLTDVSAYAKVLDYISIMNYDMFGAWSTTAGPNSPVNDTCAPPSDQEGSAAAGISNWVNAGFPPSQILLGVPSYSHSFRVPASSAFDSMGQLALYPPVDKANQPLGDGDSTTPSTDQCGNPVTAGGVLAFSSLIAQNYLTANGTPAPGIDFIFDPCSETPYVYNNSTQVMVSYDNAESFEIKGSFISKNNLAGFAMWYIGGDSGNILIDAISTGMGIKSC